MYLNWKTLSFIGDDENSGVANVDNGIVWKKNAKQNETQEKEREEDAATASTDCRFAFLHTFMQIDDNIFFRFLYATPCVCIISTLHGYCASAITVFQSLSS